MSNLTYIYINFLHGLLFLLLFFLKTQDSLNDASDAATNFTTYQEALELDVEQDYEGNEKLCSLENFSFFLSFL